MPAASSWDCTQGSSRVVMTILEDPCTILQTDAGVAGTQRKVGTMRKKMNSKDENQTRRMQADRVELAERIAVALPRNGKIEVQPGLVVTRLSSPTGPEYAVLEPWFCMIAQGAKDVLLGDEWFHYDPAHYLISTLGVPAVGRVVEASREQPYLGLRLSLDPAVVTSVMVESGVGVDSRGERAGVKGVGVSPLDADLLDATVRLVR